MGLGGEAGLYTKLSSLPTKFIHKSETEAGLYTKLPPLPTKFIHKSETEAGLYTKLPSLPTKFIHKSETKTGLLPNLLSLLPKFTHKSEAEAGLLPNLLPLPPHVYHEPIDKPFLSPFAGEPMNVLESDHYYLGTNITYLTAIWVVKTARPEHIAAISWLNESSSASFYLLQIEAIRIGDSLPTPLLTLIAPPSEEGRAIGEQKKEIVEREKKRSEFWTQLRTPRKTCLPDK